MSKWQFYLDGNLVNDPIGFDDSNISLERDPEIDGLFVKYSNKLKWIGAAYDYIKLKFENNFCDTIDIDIMYKCRDGNFDLLFRGIIILSELEFDEQKCTCDATIEDDSFSGRITRNKNIDAKVDVAFSKNQVVITPVAQTSLLFFTVSTGNYLPNTRYCYSVYECFKYLISFMTDGLVGFASDYFSTGDGSNLYVTTGKEIRTFDHSGVPMFSFKDLFVNINKKYSISFSVQLVGGQRIMRIENKEYFYQNTALTTLPNVPDILVKIDQSRLYANVKVGNANVNDDPSLSFPSGIRFLNWKQEKYHVLGECSIDTTLDLVNDWYIDSNSIEDILVNSNDQYDENIFIVTSDNGANVNKGDPFAIAPPYFYNRELMNDMVIPRWLGGIPNSIASFLGNGNDEFSAHRTANTNILVDPYNETPGNFGTETSDPNNNYNNATFTYIAPQNGMYVFEAKVFLTTMVIVTLPNEDYQLIVKINRKDSGGGLIVAYPQTLSSQAASDSLLNNTGAIYCDAGDKISVDITVQNYVSGTIRSVSYFKCVNAITGGGVFANFETKQIRPFVFDFKYPVTYSDFKNILDNYSQLISFYKVQNKNFDGWLDKIVYPVKTGLAQWTLISEKY